MLPYLLTRFTRPRDAEGASAVEYGLLISGIAAVIVLAVYTFGGVVNDALFSTTCTTVTSGMGTPAQCTGP